jgi:hypothetical protein
MSSVPDLDDGLSTAARLLEEMKQSTTTVDLSCASPA